jgi:glycosyltransferase involved in cell wall biosynthesis
MRLLFVGTNRGPGGTESHFITLVTALVDAGHDLAVAVWAGDLIDTAISKQTPIRRYDVRFRRAIDSSATRALLSAVRAERPDAIVGSFSREYWSIALLGRALGVPVVLFRHIDHRLRPRGAERVLPHLVRRFLVPSEFLLERMVARGLPRAKAAVLHNPIDARALRPDAPLRAETRRALGFAPDDLVVGFVGRIERSKGVLTLGAALDRAMARVPSLRALWIGSGRLEGEVRALAGADHRARHVRLPWTTGSMAGYYNAMDVLAFPSIGTETFGRVSIEAQSCGVPVLGSRTGGVAESMRPDVTGRLLPPGDVAAWADALVALAEDAAGRARMGRAAREFAASTFDAPRIVADLERLLEDALSRR